MRDAPDDDEATFAALFHAHFRGMHRLAALLGADDPEDVAQEAFLRLHGTASRLRDPDRALPYLRAIVCNLARSRVRRLRVVRRHAPPHVPDAASAESAVLLSAARREVLDALGGLPARQREALVLRYWLDLSGPEIATAMGISHGAVKSHTSRGLAALELALEARA